MIMKIVQEKKHENFLIIYYSYQWGYDAISKLSYYSKRIWKKWEKENSPIGNFKYELQCLVCDIETPTIICFI